MSGLGRSPAPLGLPVAPVPSEDQFFEGYVVGGPSGGELHPLIGEQHQFVGDDDPVYRNLGNGIGDVAHRDVPGLRLRVVPALVLHQEHNLVVSCIEVRMNGVLQSGRVIVPEVPDVPHGGVVVAECPIQLPEAPGVVPRAEHGHGQPRLSD